MKIVIGQKNWRKKSRKNITENNRSSNVNLGIKNSMIASLDLAPNVFNVLTNSALIEKVIC